MVTVNRNVCLHRMWAAVGLTLVVAACSSGEVSLTDCVERINAAVDRTARRYFDLVGSPQGEELSETPEMATYHDALTADKQQCADSQAEMNAIVERRDVFAETPWIPGDLNDVVEAVLGCNGFLEYPADVYRPPPTSSPWFVRTSCAVEAGATQTVASPLPRGAEDIEFPAGDFMTRREGLIVSLQEEASRGRTTRVVSSPPRHRLPGQA